MSKSLFTLRTSLLCRQRTFAIYQLTRSSRLFNSSATSLQQSNRPFHVSDPPTPNPKPPNPSVSNALFDYLPEPVKPSPEESQPVERTLLLPTVLKSGPSLGRPIFWSILFGGSFFIWAIYQTKLTTLVNYHKYTIVDNFVRSHTQVTKENLKQHRENLNIDRAKLEAIYKQCTVSEKDFPKKSKEAREGWEITRRILASRQSEWQIVKFFNMKPDPEKICYGIVGLNAAVWLAWKNPRLSQRMLNSFTHWPLSGRSYTMLTSVFSHQSFWHLACNSFVLMSFGPAVFRYLQPENRLTKGQGIPEKDSFFTYDFDKLTSIFGTKKEDNGRTMLIEMTSKFHFLAFFVLGGLTASMFSHSWDILYRLPRLLRVPHLAVSAKTREMLIKKFQILPSLGASGAICSCITFTTLAHPESAIALIFLPWFPIPIAWGTAAMVTMDLIGLLRGWSVFGHAAHLGGAAFGVLYFYICNWWDKFPDFSDFNSRKE